MNTLIKRVAQLPDILNVKITNIETKIGASKGVLSRAIKNDSDIQAKWLISIVENYPLINPIWLLTGKGEILIKDIEANHEELKIASEPEARVYKLRTDRIYSQQSIPLYPIEATAGVVTLFNDANNLKPLDYIEVPNLPKCDGAVYVTGDSMYPLLKNGDIIMYKQIKDFVFGLLYGEIYLVNMEIDGDDYISVKWLHKSEKGEDWIKLVSENRYHPDRDVPLSKIRALALVKASIRINSMS